MDTIINALIKGKGSDLLSGLVGSGFTQDQAEKFLPEAGKSISGALSGGESVSDTDSILSKIDIASLAAKVGIDSSMATKGLKSLIPLILSKLGGESLGGMLGKAKGFF